MTLKIGEIFPSFAADTTTGLGALHDGIDENCASLFSCHTDFISVRTTEMGCTSQKFSRVTQWGVKPTCLSAATFAEHVKSNVCVKDTQDPDFKFPIVADTNLAIPVKSDAIHPKESKIAAALSGHIIDPDKKIRRTMAYPTNVGHNFDEISRRIDALRKGGKNMVSEPVNRVRGHGMILSDTDANTAFPYGFEVIRSKLHAVKL